MGTLPDELLAAEAARLFLNNKTVYEIILSHIYIFKHTYLCIQMHIPPFGCYVLHACIQISG